MESPKNKDKEGALSRCNGKDAPPEGGFGWIVVIATHLVLFFSYGNLTSFGPFVVRLKDYFDEGAGTIGGVSGIAVFITLVTGSIANGLSSRFGYRVVVCTGGVISTLGLILSSFIQQAHQLYVTYSIITAIGYSLVVTPAMSFPAKYFKKRYALANGIAFSGIAVAWIALPPLSQFLIEVYGWRGAMLIFAAITSNICVCSVLLIPPPQRRYLAKDTVSSVTGQNTNLLTSDGTQKSEHCCRQVEPIDNCLKRRYKLWKNTKCGRSFLSVFDVSLFANPLFVLIFVDQMIISIAFFPTLLFLVARAISYGIPQPLPATLLTVWGISSLFGRLTHGYIIDRKILTSVQGLVCGLMICGLVNIFSCFQMNFLGLALMYGLFGLSNGVYHPLTTVVIRDFVGTEKFPSGQGLNNVARGIGGLLGAPIVGWIYDVSGNYNVCYIFSGGVFILSSLLLLLAPVLRRCRSKSEHSKWSTGIELKDTVELE